MKEEVKVALVAAYSCARQQYAASPGQESEEDACQRSPGQWKEGEQEMELEL